MRPIEDGLHDIWTAPYEATIRHHRRWGPWAWSFELHIGLCAIGEAWGAKRWHAWTEEGVERKARRVIARLERWDYRNFPEHPKHQTPVLHWLQSQGGCVT